MLSNFNLNTHLAEPADWHWLELGDPRGRSVERTRLVGAHSLPPQTGTPPPVEDPSSQEFPPPCSLWTGK